MRIKTNEFVSFIVITMTILSCSKSKETSVMTNKDMNYPVAEIKDSVLTQHGNRRVDPYFWMRLTDAQKTAKTPDEQTIKVLDYLKAENDFTERELKHTEQVQEKLYEEMVGRIKKNDESVPYFKNGYWYYIRYEEGKEYPIHCRKKGTLSEDEEVILDVNLQAEGHDYYAATGLSVSPDNQILAFNEDTVSRRIYTVRFKNLSTGEFLSDKLSNSDGDGAWADDNKTFFYTAKNKVSLLSEKIMRHRLGTEAGDDELVYHEQDPSYYIGVYRSKSGKYIIIYNSSTLVSDYHILKSDDPNGQFEQFTKRDSKHEYSIDHYEDKFYIVTNDNAENFRLMETSISNTSKVNWKEVIAHRQDVLLEHIEVFENYLVVAERSNALTNLKVIDQKTSDEHYLEFDEPAYLVFSGTNPEFNTSTIRFGYSSMTTPTSIYDYDMKKRVKELKKRDEVVGGHDPEQYVTERLFAEGRDGTQIPISLVYNKNIDRSITAPMVLYAYGSYGSSTDPWFNSSNLSLLDRGFIWAIAHIRGGQEMGRQWYENGKMFHKKNTFYDYIDCAQFLISEKYTSEEHLYGYGGSAGGLLMGAVANMAPKTFNGLIAAVPFVDVVSTMLDESIPLTTNEFDEWGNPKNLESYEYMLSYSPYDQVGAQDYPNMLVTTGFFDSQVQYWEPAKWVAKLRANKTDNNKLFLHTNLEAGHGGASGRFKRYKEKALNFAFLLDLENVNED